MASERLQRHIDRLLDEADEAIAQSHWDVVRDRAKDILAIDPQNSEGLAFLAAAERALGDSGPSPSVQPPPPAPTTRSDEPTTFTGGRYEVKRFLGEGEKKKVYLAHDTMLDRDVAFALIKTEGLDDVSRTRVSREAQAMGQPGVPLLTSSPSFDLGST